MLLELESVVASGTGDLEELAKAEQRAEEEQQQKQQKRQQRAAAGSGGGAGAGGSASDGSAAPADGGDAMDVDAQGDANGSEESDGEGNRDDGDGDHVERNGDASPVDDENDGDGSGDGVGARSTKARRRSAAHHMGAGAPAVDADEDVLSDVEDAEVTKSRAQSLMWLSRAERASWRGCVAVVAAAPQLAYCAAVLEHVADGALAALAKAGRGGRKLAGAAASERAPRGRACAYGSSGDGRLVMLRAESRLRPMRCTTRRAGRGPDVALRNAAHERSPAEGRTPCGMQPTRKRCACLAVDSPCTARGCAQAACHASGTSTWAGVLGLLTKRAST
eukprot:349878-Chlamydomonas_euryale.AAC.10